MNKLIGWIRQLANPCAREGALRVNSSVRLGPHHTIYAVSLGNRHWTIVCHSSGATELSEGESGENLSSRARAGAL